MVRATGIITVFPAVGGAGAAPRGEAVSVPAQDLLNQKPNQLNSETRGAELGEANRRKHVFVKWEYENVN